MPDSWILNGNLPAIPSPGATQVELASYCIAEEGIDFGADALFQNAYSENPGFEGGRFAFRHSTVRRFRFPLRLASSWPGPNGLNGLEDHIRKLARGPQNAYIDLLPESATYAIRFDVIDGRVNWRNYNVYMQRIARRDV